MATTLDDDFDMPEMTDEILAEFRMPAPTSSSTHTDLHMGAATVAPVKKAVAKRFDWTGVIANAAVGAGYLSAVWLFVQVWIWVLSS
jgi:hypothetical protein